MAKSVYIGIDLGGTRIRAARLSTSLEIEARSETPSLADEGLEAVISRIFEQAEAVWPDDNSKVLGVGISAPGPVNPRTGVLVKPPNLPGWHNVPLEKICQERFGVRTYLGNDANVAALAEAELGAARGFSDVLFLTISTGIGGGIISGGRMLVGAEGLGAECGHVVMIVEDGKVSSLEKEAAGTHIARYAREGIANGEKSSITNLVGSIEDITAKHVSQAAKEGDAFAKKLMARTGKIIGYGISSFLHVLNSQIVVLGGGVMEGSWELLFPSILSAIKETALDPEYWNHLIIVPAALGENVSLIGAGALALRKGE